MCLTDMWILCFFLYSSGSSVAQKSSIRKGAGYPTAQRHLPKRPTDPPGQEDYIPNEKCPLSDGFFPDEEQCDKYYHCV